jgi:predicted HicB family RNase H-like nuclease
MARPSKGDRKRLGRLPADVHEALEKEAVAHGASSVSQYVSDLLCLHVGRRDLVQEISQEVLPLTA